MMMILTAKKLGVANNTSSWTLGLILVFFFQAVFHESEVGNSRERVLRSDWYWKWHIVAELHDLQ